VPIVVLCYGGGPMTIKTLIAAGDKPLIIVRGSDRAAKFVDDYVGFERRKVQALDNEEGKGWHPLHVRIGRETRQKRTRNGLVGCHRVLALPGEARCELAAQLL
jgi:hypothetical protein